MDARNSKTSPIPQIDISPFLYSSSKADRDGVVATVREACLSKGFLSITGHSITTELQMQVFAEIEAFFALPFEEKDKLLKRNSYGKSNRGYEQMYEQNLSRDARGVPDAKEGFYLGVDLPLSNPKVQAQCINCGPNVYPPKALLPSFKNTFGVYHFQMFSLAVTFLRIMALSLCLPETFFESAASQDFATNINDTVASLKLLHYPPVKTDGYACAAHTDFGAVTLLMQDSIGGLQVWDDDLKAFLDVPAPWKRSATTDEPYPYVVNLGDAMARWTNDRYRSTLHRVVVRPTTGEPKPRYSVPFFFNGNGNTVMAPLDGTEAKHPVTTVEEHLIERFRTTVAKPLV